MVAAGAEAQTPDLTMMALEQEERCQTEKTTHDVPQTTGDKNNNNHLQSLYELKLISVPLLDLLVFSCCEEEVSLGDKLEEHDTVEKRQTTKRVDT